MIDVLRLASVVGVVWFHAHAPGEEYLKWRLPVLVGILAFFVVRQRRPSRLSKYISGRSERLLLPWAVWSVVFLGVLLARRQFGTIEAKDEFAGWMLLVGPSIHLWFLPFALVASATALAIRNAADWYGRPWLIGHACALFGFAIFALTHAYSGSLPVPLAQWSIGVPAALFGIAIGLYMTGDRGDPAATAKRESMSLLFFVAGIALPLAVLIGAATVSEGTWPWGVICVMPILAFAAWSPIETPASLRPILNCTLGIYLIHPLFLSGLSFVSSGEIHPAWQATIAIVCAWLMTLAMLRTPILQKIV